VSIGGGAESEGERRWVKEGKGGTKSEGMEQGVRKGSKEGVGWSRE
jgi:hypothetical protein